MNKSPFNYLITIALGAILWMFTAIFIGASFSESLMLAISTPEEFHANLRVIFGIAAGLGIINCLYWYYYGGLASTSSNLARAKQVWVASFIIQIVIAGGLLVLLVFMNLEEGLTSGNWVAIFGLISLHSWFFFWLCTFFMSPRTVKYIPLLRN